MRAQVFEKTLHTQMKGFVQRSADSYEGAGRSGRIHVDINKQVRLFCRTPYLLNVLSDCERVGLAHGGGRR